METGKLHFEDTKRRLWLFFAVLVVFWLVSLYWWVTMGYDGTFQWMNQFQYTPLNYSSHFFFTNLGDGIILPALILVFFWRKDPALAITFALAFLFTGTITQVAKRLLFDDAVRPTVYSFNGPVSIFVKEVVSEMPSRHSFPSGHATSIATGGVFFAWGMFEWRKWLPMLIGVFTIFLCFTRVFLGVHFPGDIFVGSMIGSIGALLVLLVAYPRLHNRLHTWQRLSDPRLGIAILVFAGLLIVGQFSWIAIKYMLFKQII
jgi:membrane-associated phospholipid phosphatase